MDHAFALPSYLHKYFLVIDYFFFLTEYCLPLLVETKLHLIIGQHGITLKAFN